MSKYFMTCKKLKFSLSFFRNNDMLSSAAEISEQFLYTFRGFWMASTFEVYIW
ncbi:hypothetical protein GIB67_021979 [Kingdonia uniflora]|uniref:Uncharacterized protein n=1 Tax=Kingdonia uniflora TaxID=39325 RepID=A0A7J7P7S9_9MAGN|nr:hypothetical protein GIB67_021979 [Kingdonia uniflora]